MKSFSRQNRNLCATFGKHIFLSQVANSPAHVGGSIVPFSDVNEILFQEKPINRARLHRSDTFRRGRIGSDGSRRSFQSISFAGAVGRIPRL